jgi:hypothetical protein
MSQAEALGLAGRQAERARGEQERDVVVRSQRFVEAVSGIGIGELLVQPLRPVLRVGEEHDAVHGLVGVALSRPDAIQLEAGQPDLVRLVEVGTVEAGLAGAGDAVTFAGVGRRRSSPSTPSAPRS